MSVNRNKSKDRANTRKLMKDPGNDCLYKDPGDEGKNWLGHSFKAKTSELDGKLLLGASIEELENIRKAIPQHIRHLEREHGLPVNRQSDGRYRIDIEGDKGGSSSGDR